MKKKGVLLVLIISIIALAVITIYSKTKSNYKMKEDEPLINKMQSAIRTSTFLDLKTIIDFQWDELYIITPYGEPKTILEENNIKWINIDESIKKYDDINLLVFTFNKNIVAYINFPRKFGDFYPVKSTPFGKKEAIFNIDKDKNEIKITHK